MNQQASDLTWIKLDGYFSVEAHDGPTWLGIGDGRIQAIQQDAPDAGEHLDAPEGCVAVPLLADTHVHYYMEPYPLEPDRRDKPGSQPFEIEVEQAMDRVRKALRHGMGCLRDMGDPHGINLEVRKRFKESREPAPELVVPGPAIHRPGKYGRYLGVVKETIDDIKRFIDELVAERGVDYIKIVATGIVNFAEKRVRQSPQYTVAELEDVVRHAHAHGKKVAVHCSGTDGLDICIDAGVDFIEHAYFITPEQIERLAGRHLIWTPTFVPVYVQGTYDACGWPEETKQSIKEIISEHAASVAKGRSAGVMFMAGTDAGCPGVDMATGIRQELKCMVLAGFSAAELLRMATVTNAQLCGARTYTGRLEVGQPASFGLYRRAPWRDIQALDDLYSVFVNGEQFVQDSHSHENTRAMTQH